MFDKINSHKFLYLTSISEPHDNTLRLLLEEAIISPEEKELTIGKTTIDGSREIISTKDCAKYEVIFDWYICYSISNESFTVSNEYEEFEGKTYRIYKKSYFLDYVEKATIATQKYPGPYKHYSFCCLNHIIDIASSNEPKIREIEYES